MKASSKILLALCTLTLTAAAATNKAADPASRTDLGVIPAAAATPAGDEILRVARAGYLTRALPAGPDRPGITEFSEDIEELTVLPDGRRLAITFDAAAENHRGRIFLSAVAANGDLVRLGEVTPAVDRVLAEIPLDLKADATGRLYLLTSVGTTVSPPEYRPRLVELDPDDAATLRSIYLTRNDVTAIAATPAGFWALSPGRLRSLDPATGKLGLPAISLGQYAPIDLDTDSSGAIWFWQEGVCSPPCPSFFRLDPATGAIAPALQGVSQAVLMQDLAIERRCSAFPSGRCLQGGRFRAELMWRDFGGQSGAGRVVEGGSADTALFYFFEPKNWELMVKVLNGCGQNGHFWVYGAASTTVEYQLTVTDLETGAMRTYGNPLGQLGKTITDAAAFTCN